MPSVISLCIAFLFYLVVRLFRYFFSCLFSVFVCYLVMYAVRVLCMPLLIYFIM